MQVFRQGQWRQAVNFKGFYDVFVWHMLCIEEINLTITACIQGTKPQKGERLC